MYSHHSSQEQSEATPKKLYSKQLLTLGFYMPHNSYKKTGEGFGKSQGMSLFPVTSYSSIGRMMDRMLRWFCITAGR